MRIGNGFDVHRLVTGRPLIIGGVRIEYKKGLLGHSDADALLHAICDALLGAAGMGDIGRHFPDTDPEYRGMDSRILLQRTWEKVAAEGYEPVNLDCIIFAQAPKMAPHTAAMEECIAGILGIDASRINIKATTTEKLGFIGRGEGIAAQCVSLLEKVKLKAE